jgi:class 3 adenylate cyclase
VLSCGLVGASALLTGLEPDDLHLLMQAMHTACVEVVERFDGFIAHHTEQGTVVYFGYPQAHEDDALRAVRAGLRWSRHCRHHSPRRSHGQRRNWRFGSAFIRVWW